MKLKFTFIAILAMLSSFAVNAANSQQVDVVLPAGVSESTFGANTVTDGTNYYATLQAATEAVVGNADAVLYCKPSADVGSLQHAPVTATLTVYGNGASVTGGSERDFDFGNTDPSGGKDITADMTLTVKNLNGCGAWGTKATEHTVNLVFENCANMGKVYINGTTGTLNITINDCAFEGVLKEAVYSNADGAITLNNVAFSNLNKAINLNHKAAGTQTVTINGCSFTNCGNDVAADQIPVRVLTSVEGGKSVLNVSNATFSGTPEGGADILLDYGVGVTEATVTGTAANVLPENKENNAEMVSITKNEGYSNVAPTDVKVATLADLQAALAAENELPIIITETIVIPEGETVALDLNGKTVTRQDEATNYAINNLGTLTIKDTKGNGSINARGIYNGYGNGGAAIFNYGIADIQGGNFTSIGGYSLNNQAGASMIIADGVTANNGIYASNATLVVNGGEINGNRSGCHVLYAWNSNVTIAGGTFHNNNSGNSTTMAGGTTKLTINGGTFSIANGKSTNGWTSCLIDATDGGKYEINGGEFKGHFRVQANCAMEINDGTFENTHGEAYVNGGTVAVKGGTFTDAAAQKFATDNLAAGYELGADGKVTSSIAYVAKIGEQGYATLSAALEATKAMTGDVTVEILDKVTFNLPLIGNYSSINFVGKAENAEMYLDVQGYTTATGKEVTFTDLKLSKSEGGYVANAGFMNLAFGIYDVKKVTYNNCTFINGACASSGDVTFNDCTFYRSHDRYGLWAYGAPNVVVDGCTFADIRGIKLWDEGKQKLGALTVKNTDFSAVDGKPAIVLTSGKSVTLAGNTYNTAKGALELDLDGNPNGTPVTSDVTPVCVNDNGACGVLVDGKIYTTVAQAAEVATSGSNVTLLHNSNETVEFAYGVVLDKNGFTADNVTTAKPVAKIGEQGYVTLSEAFAAVTDDNQTVVVLQDVTEELTGAYLRGNITTENGAKVTITLTNTDWVYCPYTFVLGENITLNVPYLFYYAGGAQINGTVIAGAYYQRYGGTKLTVNEPGSLTVTSEMCYIRYTDGDANAGIYVNGDNNDETVGLNLSVAYFYQGMIYAKDANIKTAVYWQTNETDGQGSANLVLDNSTLNVTVNEHNFKATGNSTVTLTNGSSIVVAGAFETGSNTEVSVDATSSITDKNGQVKFGLSGEGTYDNPFLISSVDDLVLFRNSVNAGETKYNAEGVYVALGANINLAGIDWSVNIGDDCAVTFDGIFDGMGFTISNLTATETATKADGYICTGLFGAIYDKAVVKNFTLENVTINAPYVGNNVSAVVGFAYACKGSIENVKVVGVNINAPKATGVGAIVGYDYYSPALKVENCIVDDANITAAAYAGGLVGYASSKIAMNNNTIEDVTVSATASVGAVAGIMLGGGSATDNTVKNVTLTANGALWANSSAAVAGTITGGAVTVSNTTVENVTANGADARLVGGILVEKPTTEIAKVQAQIGDKFYTTLQAAATAAKENETVTLIADVEATEALNINCALDLNGHSLMATVAPTALPEGYAALPNLDGKYVIGAQPTATVNDLGATTVAAGDYMVYGSGDNSEDMPLSFVMQFLADQTEEDMKASPYAEWYGDFVLTFTGLENGEFTADGCYLAGHYGSFGWVKVPVDGMVIEDGARYPVMLGVGMGQKYDYICSSVQDFKCALYLTPEILAANPNIEVKLELGVVDNSKGSDAAASALVNNENVYSVTEYTYDALDFDPNYIKEYTIDDANPVDFENDSEKTVGTLTYKRNLIEGVWNALYLPFEIDVEELVENYDIAYYHQMHSYDSDNNGSFDSYEMEDAYITSGRLRANYPYFIRPKSPEACALEYVAEDVTLYPAVEKKIVTSSVANIFTLSGTHKAMGKSELTGCYAISVDGDWSGTEALKAHRLYLKIEENDNSPFAPSAAKSIRIVVRGEGDGTTGVEEVETENEEVKAIYDLTGRRVQETVKGGIYIINGKKTIVK